MAEPNRVNLKRKHFDQPPDFLFLDSSSKRDAKRLHYVREGHNAGVDSNKVKQDEQKNWPALQSPVRDEEQKTEHGMQRHYHLNRVSKRTDNDGNLATFVEKRPRSAGSVARDAEDIPQFEPTVPDQVLKRPSRNAAVKRVSETELGAEIPIDRAKSEELAAYMYLEALEQLKREEGVRKKHAPFTTDGSSRVLARPRISGQRSKEIHRQRAITNGSTKHAADIEMDDDSDYVYDTYILAPSSELGALEVKTLSDVANVGYLVITQEDQSLWETYREDEPSDKDWDSDEEDENAEDYYGADYPEDELASDDEFDRNAYDFRGQGAADDEEWDEDTGAYSDDEHEHMMQPFKYARTPQQFAKYLEKGGESGE